MKKKKSTDPEKKVRGERERERRKGETDPC